MKIKFPNKFGVCTYLNVSDTMLSTNSGKQAPVPIHFSSY